MIARLAREPLLHFAVAGAVLFAAWSWLRPEDGSDSDPEVIVVDRATLENLTNLWKIQWRRDPAPEDVAAIVERHLRQEVFYREALALGLDRDDQIIRNRLAQKMEAVATDLGALMEPPDEARLRTFYQERPDLFSLPPAVAFRQVLFMGDAADDAAGIQKTLDGLRDGAVAPESLRGAGMLPLDWPPTPVPALNNAFGGDFAQTLPELPVGEWSGPVRSGYGMHLVRVDAIAPAGPPPFEEVRDLVARQYAYYAALDAQARMYAELLRKYTVRVEAEGVPEEVRIGLAQR